MLKFNVAISALLAGSLISCTAPNSVPEQASKVNSREVKLPAGKVHEECMRLKPDQKLNYSFRSNAPVQFNIHYHEGKDVSYPIKHDNSSSDAGIFQPKIPQDYCLMWTNFSKSDVSINFDYKIH